MKIYRYPTKDTWKELVQRPVLEREEISGLIAEIFAEVESNGDQALIAFNKKFDQAETKSIAVTEDEIINAENELSDDLKQAIQQAKENIFKFHASQNQEVQKIETTKGVVCW
ncbi:histidinol dehydrogenase, partial [Chryseobacterium contaminans]